jgi:hypothetical protein
MRMGSNHCKGELILRRLLCGSALRQCMSRVGQKHTSIGIYNVHTVFVAGKSPYVRSYTMQIYGSGQLHA